MFEIFLYIAIGSVAGVFAFVSCMIIWDVDLKKDTPEISIQHSESEKQTTTENSIYTPLGNEMRFSIPVSHEEISLSSDNDFIAGSFIDLERKVNGVQTFQRFFLN